MLYFRKLPTDAGRYEDGQTASKVHEKIFASKNLPYAAESPDSPKVMPVPCSMGMAWPNFAGGPGVWSGPLRREQGDDEFSDFAQCVQTQHVLCCEETGAAVLESTITGLNQINQRSGAPPPTLAVPLASVVALFSWF